MSLLWNRSAPLRGFVGLIMVKSLVQINLRSPRQAWVAWFVGLFMTVIGGALTWGAPEKPEVVGLYWWGELIKPTCPSRGWLGIVATVRWQKCKNVSMVMYSSCDISHKQWTLYSEISLFYSWQARLIEETFKSAISKY